MSQRISWLITDNNVTVNYQGQTHIVKRSDPLSDSLILAIKEHRLDDVPNLISYAKAMEHQSKGVVQVRDGELLVKGIRVPTELAKKIQKFMDEGLPFEPLVKFAENLQRNPSFRAVNELFQFLEKNDHPLTENGNFIAYKRVKGDFTDIHTGTFDNSPGTVVEMPRNEVDEDCNRTCSRGLHCANWWYSHTQFGSTQSDTDVMLEVEVDPADVVAVPSDYANSKMRVCRYKVLGVVENEYTGSSLRITEQPKEQCPDCGSEDCKYQDDYVEDKVKDESGYCYDCGEYAVVDSVCEACGCEDECVEEEDECCQECGDELCCDDTLCDNCLDAEEERRLDEEEEEREYEDDEYPWEDEV